MRLTAYHKRAFVSGIMADTPVESITVALRETLAALDVAGLAVLPPEVKALINLGYKNYLVCLNVQSNMLESLFEDPASRNRLEARLVIPSQAQTGTTVCLYGAEYGALHGSLITQSETIKMIRKSSREEAVTARQKWEKLKSLIKERDGVEKKLKTFIDSVSTRKQVLDRHPEFEKYLPKEDKEPRPQFPIAHLPIKDELVNLGWKPAAKVVTS